MLGMEQAQMGLYSPAPPPLDWEQLTTGSQSLKPPWHTRVLNITEPFLRDTGRKHPHARGRGAAKTFQPLGSLSSFKGTRAQAGGCEKEPAPCGGAAPSRSRAVECAFFPVAIDKLHIVPLAPSLPSDLVGTVM